MSELKIIVQRCTKCEIQTYSFNSIDRTRWILYYTMTYISSSCSI